MVIENRTFHQVGFNCVDVHIQDLISKTFDLSYFDGLAVSRAFLTEMYLERERGWAQLFWQIILRKLSFLFCNPEKFVFGVCNGCQFLSELARYYREKEDWPNFSGNISGLEARQSLLKFFGQFSLFKGMQILFFQ